MSRESILRRKEKLLVQDRKRCKQCWRTLSELQTEDGIKLWCLHCQGPTFTGPL